MKWIGLTGGIACGKTAAHQVLVNLGYPVVDADQLARQTVEPGSAGLDEVVRTFGREVLSPRGELDRKRLGDIVFADSDKLSLLEKTLHPLIQQEALRQKELLRSQGYQVAFYVVPLLFEKNLAAQFDQTVLICCDDELQIQRLMQRERLSREQAELRLDAQWPLDEKKKLADLVIENNGTLTELEDKVKAFCRSIPSPR